MGAGSAGAVVANRLSENPAHSVLLLEAGGDETEVSDVPALAGYLQLSKLDWQYKTEPQPTACLAYIGHVSMAVRSDSAPGTCWLKHIKRIVNDVQRVYSALIRGHVLVSDHILWNEGALNCVVFSGLQVIGRWEAVA